MEEMKQKAKAWYLMHPLQEIIEKERQDKMIQDLCRSLVYVKKTKTKNRHTQNQVQIYPKLCKFCDVFTIRGTVTPLVRALACNMEDPRIEICTEP